MKIGIITSAVLVGSLLAGSALADESGVASNGPQAPIATFTSGKSTQAREQQPSVSHVQICRVTKAGDLDCSAPVALQGKADRSAK